MTEPTQDYPLGGSIEPYDIEREKELTESDNFMKERCDHYWIPIVNLSLNAGSLGSQTGYLCMKCHKQDLRWPDGHYKHGSEQEIVELNKNINKK